MDLVLWDSLGPGDQVRHSLTGDAVWTFECRWTKEHLCFVTDARGPLVPATGKLVSNEHRGFTLTRRAGCVAP